MFRLEKVFQNNDIAYISFTNILKSILLIIVSYFSIIFENNTIYDIGNYNIFFNSNYFFFSIIVAILFLLLSFLFNHSSSYQKNIISFFKKDLFVLFISYLLSLAVSAVINNEFKPTLFFIYQFIIFFFSIFFSKIFFNKIYNYMIDKNIIQKNIMLVGTYKDILKVLNSEVDKIFVFKCCIVKDIKNHNEKILKSEIKIPIFKQSEDIRAILEYHALGQIWTLTNEEINKNDLIFNTILKFSVDILIVKTNTSINLRGNQLLSNKFEYEIFEISRFHGVNFFLKILLDKFLSVLFLLVASPLIIISMITIYIEDGMPLLFTQNRTGWDGRRFKIYKLRTLKKEKFDKTIQVKKDDARVLKFGKIIRRYSIDELPQFLNVFLGDMSIVGPRPHMVEHDIKYSQLFANFLKRHKCSPGLTGWAQVNGLRGATPDPNIMKRRMEFDLWYLNNWTLMLDFYIILKTFYALFKYKGD